jgi:hypothetical protein
MTLTRLSPVFDPTRFNPNIERKLQVTAELKAWAQARYALPYTLPYQLDARTKYRSEMNQIVHQLMLKFFTPQQYLTVDWGTVYGKKPVLIGVQGGITDNSQLEPGVVNQPTFRSTLTLAVAAFFPQPVGRIPSALQITTDIYTPAPEGPEERET